MSASNRRRWIFRAIAATAIGAMSLAAAACGSSSAAGPATSGSTASSDASSSGSTAPGTTAPAAGASSADASSDSNSAPGDEKAPLTMYSGQHEPFAQALAAGFTKATGIKVTLRSGDDAELVNQIIEEGAGSPADLYLSEEPGPVAMLDSKGLTSPIDKAALAEVDQRLLPSTSGWLPYAARTRVIFYNPALISEKDLPASVLDLTDPKWKGKFAYAPSGAFTSTVSYLISSIGPDKTLAWLKGIKANGVNEQKNGKVRDSVEAGQHPFGLSNHYYWYVLAAQKGADKLTSKVYFFDHDDAGGLLLTSGAAVLKSSKHQAEAQEFVKWLGAADGGQQVVAGDGDAQFPVAPGVTSKSGIPALSDLHFPTVDPTVYADTSEAKDLIIKSGIA
ncbi:MAG: extracellular solute-binding protein [Nakamurella sp.]